jgi:hypothetical protein
VLKIAQDTHTSIVLSHQPRQVHTVIIRQQVQGMGSLDHARELLLRMLEATHQSNVRERMGSFGAPEELYESTLEVTETVMLPKVQYHKLVSTGYTALNRIAMRVGCRIDITEDIGTGMGIVTFRGHRMQVEEAQDLLRVAFDKRPHTFTTSTVPPGFQAKSSGMLAGSGRDRSPSPSRSSNALPLHSGPTSPWQPRREHIQFHSDDEVLRRPHSFTGHSQSASGANTQGPGTPISGVQIRSSKTTPMREGPVSAFIDCEFDSVGKLIGARGSRIEELRTLTGCQIFVLKGVTAGACVVEVRGKADNVSTAVPLLKMVLGSGDVAMSKIRAMHTSLLSRSKPSSSSSFDEDEGHAAPTPPVPKYAHGGERGEGGALSLERLAEALQQHVESVSQSQPALPAENRPLGELNRSSEPSPQRAGDAPLSEGRPPRSRVISRQSSRTRDDGLDSMPTPSGSLAHSLDKDVGFACSDSDIGNDDDDSKGDEDENSFCRSVESRSKYRVTPPSSPPPAALFPGYFITPTSMQKNEEEFKCGDENAAALSERVLQDIALQSRCQIQVKQKATQTQPMLLRLKGQTDQRELAKLLVNSVLRPALYRSPGTTSSGHGVLDGMIHTMTCPPHFIKVLIGPGGRTIDSIQTQSATKILINENENEVGILMSVCVQTTL